MPSESFARRDAALNRDSGVPLRVQLRDALRTQIAGGAYRPGQLFPTEREIAAHYHVSRTTIREALTDLVQDGVLVRQQGKGTFVARAHDAFDATRLSSFTEDMRHRGWIAGSRLLDVREEAPDQDLRAHFGEHAPVVLRVARLRTANGEPIALQRSFLPSGRFRLSREDVESGSLYYLLETRYGIRIASADEVISADVAGNEEAELLGVVPNAPLLCVDRYAYSQTGEPIECARIRYRADRYRFSVHQQRGG